MFPDIGEYIVGAYLKLILKCDVVDYNVKPPVGGLEGLNELDVIGLDFKNKIAYLCEATTHIKGALYKNNEYTVKKILEKYTRQKKYAKKYLRDFPDRRYMLWSPVVPRGFITEELSKFRGLELVINETYTDRINELREIAKMETKDTNNPFFRVLQILEHLR